MVFEWGEEQQKAFEDVKTALTNPPVLAMPTQDGAYVLDTDASDVAIAGILRQWQYSEEVDEECSQSDWLCQPQPNGCTNQIWGREV